MTLFVRYIENNDHEGERWVFWLQKDGNEAALAELEQILETAEAEATAAEGYYEMPYQIPADIEPEAVVDKLVEYAEGGYMDGHNKVRGKLDLTRLRGRSWEGAFDTLYKGGIRNMFKDDTE
ncbi:hypothetical protein [Nocardia xishanensis]|uniref:hypothetical protein n=1 Tax=Nocardia xishanensis TaxID=238964 RepID=UPI00082DFAF7|nr:hypothetical protein [Nocardia xishanensis]